VPTRSESEIVNLDGWTLRVRRSDFPAPRVLLLIHGRTGDENSMWIFVRNFAANYWIVAPRAPHPTRPGGFSWLPPSSLHGQEAALKDFRPSAEALTKIFDRHATQNGLNLRELAVLGFSEGAAMAITLALMDPGRVGRLGILSGFVPGGAEELLASRPLAGKPVFVAHGARDELVGVDRARQSVRLLQRAGALVTLCEAEIGHKVSSDCLRALETFFA